MNGINRTYILAVSATATDAMKNGRVPVLMALHGAGDTASAFLDGTTLRDFAKSQPLVLIAPEAWTTRSGQLWLARTQDGWPTAEGHPDSGPNDVAFFQAALDETSREYCIDPKRYYLAGFSRGAGMTAYTAISSNNPSIWMGALSSPFAAYAINSGNNPYGDRGAPTANPKRPVWVIHGTSDSVVPFSYGMALSDQLKSGGWPDVVFTSVSGGPHNWLWQQTYGHTNQELLDWLLARPLP